MSKISPLHPAETSKKPIYKKIVYTTSRYLCYFIGLFLFSKVNAVIYLRKHENFIRIQAQIKPLRASVTRLSQGALKEMEVTPPNKQRKLY